MEADSSHLYIVKIHISKNKKFREYLLQLMEPKDYSLA